MHVTAEFSGWFEVITALFSLIVIVFSSLTLLAYFQQKFIGAERREKVLTVTVSFAVILFALEELFDPLQQSFAPELHMALALLKILGLALFAAALYLHLKKYVARFTEKETSRKRAKKR